MSEEIDWSKAPEEPLIYTQEMCDNGELPSVGMECLVYVNEWAEWAQDYTVQGWFKGFVCGVYEGLPVVRLNTLTDDKEGYFDTFSIKDIKPLPPKVDLVDGKAYQYIVSDAYKDREEHGIYFDINKCFHNGYGVRKIEKCTNITPLVSKNGKETLSD